ncbi:hypothetical protein QU481_02285 [Crenobacter sp. SG2303]|uniref:Uncharacterized protein n=1 Tax=Crenobacter oryzisoli TaxID=3056844 RepID=A0ABT7XIV5_9NEIS|nr:hypothetical protein [Crenobacter sp. SG2303]MDN0073722.1 hypothetical protein [Crenobacter sp. SG2303]
MKKIFYPALVAAVCGIVASNLSWAEKVSKSADLQKNKRTADYLYSRPLLEAMYQLGVMQDKRLGLQTSCNANFEVKPLGTVILSTIDYPKGLPHPSKGAWLSRYQFKRCGEMKVYNTLFTTNGAGKVPTAHIYYPGSSSAGPGLIKDALPSATSDALIRAGLKDCKDVNVFDMRVSERDHDVEEGGKTIKGVWNEVWTFQACGKMVDTAMTFIPGDKGGGTTFTVGQLKPSDAVAKP